MALVNRLSKVRLKELSLVDRPANQRSVAVLVKRHGPLLFTSIDRLLQQEQERETS